MKPATFFLLTVVVAISLVYFPHFWVAVCVLVDFYTPWVLMKSELFLKYHSFLVSRLTDKPEMPLQEINADEATFEVIQKLTKGFTFPLIIRGLAANTTAVKQWSDHDWWINNYGDEELLCDFVTDKVEDCTVRGFYNGLKNGKSFYVSGAAGIFEKHPELAVMLDDDAIRRVEPPNRVYTQVFMGLPGTGSDIHCALGINVFRQITGRKKWWFIPPSQTPYLIPSINVNGFSAHTLTQVGKFGGQPSPWMSKLVRYTSVLNPGDVLVNPPWFWHGILNLGEPDEVIIGSPVRYSKGVARDAAFKNNFMYQVNGLWVLYQKYGNKNVDLQTDIANNRKQRSTEVSIDEDSILDPEQN